MSLSEGLSLSFREPDLAAFLKTMVPLAKNNFITDSCQYKTLSHVCFGVIFLQV